MSSTIQHIPMTLAPGETCPLLPETIRNNPGWHAFWRNVIVRRMAA